VCPDNIEFIRRINGLAGADEVKAIVFDASYLVLGLGTSTSARRSRRLSTRVIVWLPRSTTRRAPDAGERVGIGGAYLCIYGMEARAAISSSAHGAGLELVRQTASFRDGKPWLLRFFDQIRFHPVSEERLAGCVKTSSKEIQRRDRARDPQAARIQRVSADERGGHRALQAPPARGVRSERERWGSGPVGMGRGCVRPPHRTRFRTRASASTRAVASPVSGSV